MSLLPESGVVHSMFWSYFFYLHNWIMLEAKILARSHICTGSLEHLLLADVISNRLSCAGPIKIKRKSDRTFNALVNVNAPVVATTSWCLHFSAQVVA